MCSKLIRSSFSMLVLVISISIICNKYNYAENIENNSLKCLQKMADSTINMLVATRSVVAKNQDLINIDPITGNYYFKGFVPALVGSEIANDFSLMTGYKLKQTSLKLRNLNNKPDEWEESVLKKFELSIYPKGAGYGEILEIDGSKIYRYMKPIYIEKACLKCHTSKDETRPEIRKFLERKYPYDQAFGYKEGDVRGGISIIISLED
jgi:methyl-accepting chemotaxis protein